MRYVSDKRLKEILKEAEDHNFTVSSGAISVIETLIDRECKEPSGYQWQTLENFKAKPVEGRCFVSVNGWIHRATYDNGAFVDTDGSPWGIDQIDMVAPVTTPELPK